MRSYLEQKIQTAVNRYLALDPESAARMRALDEKVISIRLLGPAVEIQWLFRDGALYVKTTDFSPPDTIIISPPLSLLHLVLAADRKIFFKEHVTIEGDVELAQKVIELVDALDIDWEEYFSHWVGDVSAHQALRFLRKIKKSADYVNQTWTESLDEYIHEEINLFPPREALEDFFQAIDTLRMDTDRMALRVEKLMESLGEK